MNIKTIVDRIPKEGQINASDYPVASRLVDCKSYYLQLVEKIVQIGSEIPGSDAPNATDKTTEEFTVVEGSNSFFRTIPDVPILRVDFAYTGTTLFNPVTKDPRRLIGGLNVGTMRFFGNEKQFFVEEGKAGTMRVTYARGGVTDVFTQANYDLGSGWPSPDFLPEVFHDLLWLKPSIYKTKVKEVKTSLVERYDPLWELFVNHYGRDALPEVDMYTDEDEEGNYR